MVLKSLQFHLNFSLDLLPYRVSVSCQIKKMEQPIHIGELISGTHIKTPHPHPQSSCLLQDRHLHQFLLSNLYFHAQNVAFTRFLMPLQSGSHRTAASNCWLLAMMLCFKSWYSIQIQNCVLFYHPALMLFLGRSASTITRQWLSTSNFWVRVDVLHLSFICSSFHSRIWCVGK